MNELVRLLHAYASETANLDVCETTDWRGVAARMCVSLSFQRWLIFGPSHGKFGGPPLRFYHFRLRASVRSCTAGVRLFAFSASMAQAWLGLARLRRSCLTHCGSQYSVHSQ